MTNPVDIEVYYNTHLAKAQALPKTSVLTQRVDPDLAIVNIETGMRVLTEHMLEIPVFFPKVDLNALKVLPEIALATKYAALRAEQVVPAESQIAERLKQANELRTKLLSVAKGLAENGQIPTAEVQAIVMGKGVRDRAEDCVALAALYRNHSAAIAGKHPITQEMIDESAAVGSWLLTHLRPADAPNPPSSGPSPEVEIRNRFITLLVEGHHKLQAIAFYFHRLDWEDRAPALGSRRVSRKKAEEPTP
jgi:hypothetical protein